MESERLGPVEWSKDENQDSSNLSRFTLETEYPGNGFRVDETNMVGTERRREHLSDEDVDTESATVDFD